MTIILILLAIPGVLAVLLRLGIDLLHATRHTIEWYVARQISQQRAQRGDLSGLAEADKLRAAAAQKQRWYGMHAALWIVLLAFPLMIPGAVVVYPLYSLLWLLPRRRFSVETVRQ
jgi:hypothetical protein